MGRGQSRFAAWNRKGAASTFAPDNPRPIAAPFTDLSLEAPGHAGPPPLPQVLPK